MVFILYPFMKNRGQGISRKEMIVLIYGGLRGALGLSLALIVGVDKEAFYDFNEKDIIEVYEINIQEKRVNFFIHITR